MTKYEPESIQGVISIVPGNLYVKNQDSIEKLLAHLDDNGYDIKKEEGRDYWHGPLGERVLQRKGKCLSCNKLINVRGIGVNGNKCELCGEPTCLRYVDGGEITFSVVDEEVFSLDNPTFVIKGYDKDREKLLLYVDSTDCKKIIERRTRNFDLTPEESKNLVPALLKKFPQTFSLEKVKGIEFLAVNFKDDSRVYEHSINTHKVEGEIRNYDVVRIFKGQEINEWKGPKLTIPDFVNIYEAWTWAPLKPSRNLYEKIMSAASQSSRKDFYHQDGRPAFDKIQIDWMLKFIKNFTTINVNSVKYYLDTSLSGPDFIDTLAGLTGNDREILTMPNLGNAMTVFGKIIEGKSFSQYEANEAIKGAGLGDPDNVLGKVMGDDVVKKVLRAIDDNPIDIPTKSYKPKRRRFNID